ncbi:hypothetical protein Vretifemale_675, partial [Volvox reticuliferus]
EGDIREYFRRQLAASRCDGVWPHGTAADTNINTETETETDIKNGVIATAKTTINGYAPPSVAPTLPSDSCGPTATASVGLPRRSPPGKPAAACLPPEVLTRWFPGFKLSGTSTTSPKLRILAFHSAGNAEDMWTSEGTGVRRSPSQLLEWCRTCGVELLAVQLPGRGSRSREPFLTSAQAAANEILPVVTPLLQSGVPYAVLSHSFGVWISFELLRAVRRVGLPLPRVWCLSAMPYPDVPHGRRPWRQQRTLDDADFKDEVRGWDVNEVVFTPDMWPLYEPILRADFTIFDEYELQPDEPYKYDALADMDVNEPPPLEPFIFPIAAFWGTHDRCVTLLCGTVRPNAVSPEKQKSARARPFLQPDRKSHSISSHITRRSYLRIVLGYSLRAFEQLVVGVYTFKYAIYSLLWQRHRLLLILGIKRDGFQQLR